MKRFIFGAMLVFIGFIFSAFCFIYAVMNPWDYNGITGLKGAFLGTYTGTPFVISIIILVIGLLICFYEAYISKK
ncbi:MAG: hypothetical protein K0S01_3467 [Herbinix sp.]|jgi:hypothetical protein|nr:hypothetical protein [Herbinix sp.]